MSGTNSLFDCGKNHLERQGHGADEIFNAIELLKTRHPTALLIVRHPASSYEVGEPDE